jgi:quercetin dioxygenase-like cupin family protein
MLGGVASFIDDTSVTIIAMEKIQFFAEGELERDYVIGKVTMNKVSDKFASKDQRRELKAYFVTFYDGARTRLHYHESDQILIATEGEGRAEIIQKIEETSDGKQEFVVEESTNFKDGEAILIPAGKIHWHGGIKGSEGKFSHIAILRNTATVWL